MKRPVLFWAALALIGSAAAPPLHASGPGPFLRDISLKERVTQADAVRAAAILMGERLHVDDVVACERRLAAKGVLHDRDSYERQDVLKKGFASLLFVRAMGLHGGAIVRLAGWGPRTAFKELEFREMVPPQGEHDKMTGAELLALLRLSQENLKERGRLPPGDRGNVVAARRR